MINKVTITLNSLQQRELEYLQSLVDKAAEESGEEDNRGMLFAQVWPKRGYATVFFLPAPFSDRLVTFVDYLKGAIKDDPE